MSLMKPTPGEIYDRMTIVKLKIDFFARVNNPVGRNQFEWELIEITEYLQKRYHGKVSEKDERKDIVAALDKQQQLMQKLQDVNKQLWDLEDKRRVLMSELKMDEAEIGRNAIKTTLLNDERAAIIKEINLLYNVDAVEKTYDFNKVTAAG